MHNAICNLAGLANRMVPQSVRRFLRRQDGHAAVEFGMVVLPFFGLMFAILETALVFFAGQSLEAAVADAGRQVMTGQVQNAGYSQDDYKKFVVCSYLASGVSLFDCTNGVYVNVQTYKDFASVNSAPPVDGNGNLDPSKMNYNPGNPGDIVVVQLFYKWKIYVSLLGNTLNNMGTDRLLVATSVFRNEPYK